MYSLIYFESGSYVSGFQLIMLLRLALNLWSSFLHLVGLQMCSITPSDIYSWKRYFWK